MTKVLAEGRMQELRYHFSSGQAHCNGRERWVLSCRKADSIGRERPFRAVSNALLLSITALLSSIMEN